MSALSSSKLPSSSESVPSFKAIEDEAYGDHSSSPAPLDSQSHLGGNISLEVSADSAEENMDASIPTASHFNWVLPAAHGFSSIYQTPESVTSFRKGICLSSPDKENNFVCLPCHSLFVFLTHAIFTNFFFRNNGLQASFI